MGYRVRNEHGELQFQTFDELKEAWRQRLIDADDEILEDGSSTWRKASTLPKLMAATEERPPLIHTTARWYLIAVGVALVGIALVYGLTQNAIGLAVVFVVALFSTSFFVYSATKRSRRR